MSVWRGVTILKDDGPRKLLEKVGYKIMRELGVFDKTAFIILLRSGRSYKDARWLMDNTRDRHDALIGPDRNTHYPGIGVRATHYNRYVFARNESVPEKAIPSVLDVACGTGYGYSIFAQEYQPIDYTSGDISNRTLKYASKYYTGASYAQVSAEEFPYQTNEFDVMVGFETLEHLPNPERYLAEIKRTTNATAEVFLSVPFNQKLNIEEESEAKSYPHLHKFDLDDFKQMLHTNFDSKNITYYSQQRPEGTETPPTVSDNPSGINQIHRADSIPEGTKTLLAHINKS